MRCRHSAPSDTEHVPIRTLALRHSEQNERNLWLLRRFVQNHRVGPHCLPSALFSVSLSAARTSQRQADACRVMNDFLRELDWQPDRRAIVAGDLPYRKTRTSLAIVDEMDYASRGWGHRPPSKLRVHGLAAAFRTSAFVRGLCRCTRDVTLAFPFLQRGWQTTAI